MSQDPKSGLAPDGKSLDPSFARALAGVSARTGIPFSWLVAVIAFETAWKFRSDTRNPGSSATGLIQFMAATAKRLGTTTQELAALSAVDQLRWVEKYFAGFGSFRGRPGEDAYLAVFAPVLMGKPESAATYVAPSASYTANRAMDRDGDGKITKGEILTKIRGAHAQVVARGWHLPPMDPAGEASPGSVSSSGSAGSRGCS